MPFMKAMHYKAGMSCRKLCKPKVWNDLTTTRLRDKVTCKACLRILYSAKPTPAQRVAIYG